MYDLLLTRDAGHFYERADPEIGGWFTKLTKRNALTIFNNVPFGDSHTLVAIQPASQ